MGNDKITKRHHECRRHGLLTDPTSIYFHKKSGTTLCKICAAERSRERSRKLEELYKLHWKEYSLPRPVSVGTWDADGVTMCSRHGVLKRKDIFQAQTDKICNKCLTDYTLYFCKKHGRLYKEEIRLVKNRQYCGVCFSEKIRRNNLAKKKSRLNSKEQNQ